MGTQQILLIVLSVIIVGVAVAVGITMFNAQSVNSNRSACIADMNNFAASALAYFKTPTSHGGAGNDLTVLASLVGVGNYIGVGFNGTDSLVTGNGGFKMTFDTATLTFTAAGTESGVVPVTTVNLSTSAIATTPNP